MPKAVNDSVNQVLSISITSIKALGSQIKEFDKAITVQTELLSNVLLSISGIGPVLSACIMAEIGDINRFGNHVQLAKHVSLSLVRRDKEYRDFYHLKYKAVNRYQHKRALALIARKFMRLVFVPFKDNRLYRPAQ